MQETILPRNLEEVHSTAYMRRDHGSIRTLPRAQSNSQANVQYVQSSLNDAPNDRFSCHFQSNMVAVHKKFRAKIDQLSIVQMCHVCCECYPGIQVVIASKGPLCKRCKGERGTHHFSRWNNMDPVEQPKVLKVLTQVEEMVIARVNPILQVTHARGGKYKYSGHTISFPQDISMVATKLPHRVQDLDILIVKRTGAHSKHYDCYVKKSHVMDALCYKIKMDKYYRDIEIDMASVNGFPEKATDVSQTLQCID